MTYSDTPGPITDYSKQSVDKATPTTLGSPYADYSREDIIYKTKPQYDTWFAAFLIAVPALLIVLGVGLFFLTWIAAAILIPEAFLIALIFLMTFPRSIIIYRDRVVVSTFAFNVSTDLANILEVSEMDSCGPKSGCKFVTSMNGCILLRRRNALDLYFCPRYPKEFLSFLRYAMSPSTHERPPLRFEESHSPPTVV